MTPLPKTVFLVFGVMLCLLGQGAWAKSIVMELLTRVRVEGERISMEIEASNRGDVDALAVTPMVVLGDLETQLNTVRWIPFQERHIWRYEVERGSVGLGESGVYPLSVILEYHDANRYLFSTVYLTPITMGRSPPGGLSLWAGSLVPIASDGVVPVRLENTGETVLGVRLRVLFPLEFSAHVPDEMITLDAGESRRLEVEVRNLRALAGSEYPFHLVAEYYAGAEGPGMASATGMLRVEGLPAVESERLLGYAGLFVLLLFLLTAYMELRRTPTGS